MVLFNDLRQCYCEENEDDEAMGKFDVNSLHGHKLHSEFFASKGMAICFVGNTCPTVYQRSPDALCVAPGCGEDSDLLGKAIGSICTDLWWYCAVDRMEFEKKVAKTTTQWEEEYHKSGAWPDLIIANVTPGRYRFTDRYHLCKDEDYPRIFSTIERME